MESRACLLYSRLGKANYWSIAFIGSRVVNTNMDFRDMARARTEWNKQSG